MSRRDAIKMTDEEVQAFLAEERVVTCGTVGRDGWPHLMPLWYVLRDGRLWAWTYTKSQKARNLERAPIATLQVEAGREYHRLRGVMLKCDVTIHPDPEVIGAFVDAMVDRYASGAETAREGFRRQIPKRVALEFTERSRATWDHRKLGGTY